MRWCFIKILVDSTAISQMVKKKNLTTGFSEKCKRDTVELVELDTVELVIQHILFSTKQKEVPKIIH